MYELTERCDVIEMPVYHKQQVAVMPGVINLGVHGKVEFSDWEVVVQIGMIEVIW